MKRIIFIAFTALLLPTIIFSGCAKQAPAPVTDLQMIGATVGSGTYALNLGTAEMWNKHVEKPTKVNVSVRPYQAITETFKALDSGLVDITWAPSAFSFFISKGIGPYTPLGKKSFYKLFAGGKACPFAITVDPDVKTIADLKGKKLAAKKPADPTLDSVRTAYLEANGMTDEDVKLIEFPSNPDALRMLKEGTADAGIFLSSILTPTVEELFISKDTHFINVTDAEMDNLISKEPFWFKTFIPAGSYKGQDYDVPFPSHMEGVYVRLDFNEEMTYEMVKAIYDNFEEFSAYHASVRDWTLNDACSATRIYHPFSPGSVKYFKEKGVWTDEHEAKQQQLLKEAGL